MKIKDVSLFKEYAAFIKERGGCEQCQFPWHDGLCECGLWTLHTPLMDGMARLAYSLGNNGEFEL